MKKDKFFLNLYKKHKTLLNAYLVWYDWCSVVWHVNTFIKGHIVPNCTGGEEYWPSEQEMANKKKQYILLPQEQFNSIHSNSIINYLVVYAFQVNHEVKNHKQ
jgi:hypothetical protein